MISNLTSKKELMALASQQGVKHMVTKSTETLPSSNWKQLNKQGKTGENIWEKLDGQTRNREIKPNNSRKRNTTICEPWGA